MQTSHQKKILAVRSSSSGQDRMESPWWIRRCSIVSVRSWPSDRVLRNPSVGQHFLLTSHSQSVPASWPPRSASPAAPSPPLLSPAAPPPPLPCRCSHPTWPPVLGPALRVLRRRPRPPDPTPRRSAAPPTTTTTRKLKV